MGHYYPTNTIHLLRVGGHSPLYNYNVREIPSHNLIEETVNDMVDDNGSVVAMSDHQMEKEAEAIFEVAKMPTEEIQAIGEEGIQQDDSDPPSEDQKKVYEQEMSRPAEGDDKVVSVVEKLRGQLQGANDGVAKDDSHRVQSGSKPRPNVVYELKTRPPKWSGTPQVGQLINILFDNKLADGGQFKAKLTEPELFDLINDGAKSGVLRTRQVPVRIFQYYRNTLLEHDVLSWK